MIFSHFLLEINDLFFSQFVFNKNNFFLNFDPQI
jgi:hypothetical protein